MFPQDSAVTQHSPLIILGMQLSYYLNFMQLDQKWQAASSGFSEERNCHPKSRLVGRRISSLFGRKFESSKCYNYLFLCIYIKWHYPLTRVLTGP